MKPFSIDQWEFIRLEIEEHVHEGKGPMLYGYVPTIRPEGWEPHFFRPTDLILQLKATIDSLLVPVKWHEES